MIPETIFEQRDFIINKLSGEDLAKLIYIIKAKEEFVKKQLFEEAGNFREKERNIYNKYGIDYHKCSWSKLLDSSFNSKHFVKNPILKMESYISLYDVLNKLTQGDMNDLVKILQCETDNIYQKKYKQRQILSKYYDSIITNMILELNLSHSDIIGYMRDEKIKRVIE